MQDVFFPQAPPTSQGVANALVMLTRRTRAAGWPVKIAIIAGVRDLGPDRSFFGRPQAYADFLGSEFGAPRLLVVMPQGIGGQRLGSSLHRAGAGLSTGAGGDRGDALALLAMTVVARLAADNGGPVAFPKVDRSAAGRRPYVTAVPASGAEAAAPRGRARPDSGRAAGNASSPLPFLAPIGLVLIVLVTLTVRDRRRAPRSIARRGAEVPASTAR